jgi:hypothetical protein
MEQLTYFQTKSLNYISTGDSYFLFSCFPVFVKIRTQYCIVLRPFVQLLYNERKPIKISIISMNIAIEKAWTKIP